MENQKYGKERKIRIVYRGIGRRRTYRQRRIYEGITRYSEIQSGNGFELSFAERNEDVEDDLVRSTRSTALGRSVFLSQTRIVTLGCRTRIPGRFHHERQKRIQVSGGVRRVRSMRSWKWYQSDVDVNRSDRRRSLSFLLPMRIWMRMKGSSGGLIHDSTRFNVRERRVRMLWVGVGRYTRRRPERTELSNRRSRGRMTVGYLVCIERWRRRRYRKNGRKRIK